MADTATKLGEVTKKFKAVNKEVIARLAEYGEVVKSSTSVITDEQAAMVVDILTQDNPFTAEEIEELKAQAIAKKEKEEAAAKKEAEEKAKAEEAARVAEEKAKAEAKRAAREAAEAEAKAKRKAEEKEKKEKQKKHNAPAKKQTGVRVDLSGMDTSNATEEYIVKSEKKSRTVDTRSSNVDLAKLEKNERLEKFADDMSMNRREKNKNKKGDKRFGKNQQNNKFEQEKKPQNKPKPVVITEIDVPDTITVGEFASRMGKGVAEVVKKLMMLGIIATVNQAIDFDTAELIAAEFGITVNKEIVLSKEDKLFMEIDEEDKPEDLIERPPVVVVMGHVDHGKTSLLDAIRDTHVTTTEAGGITQHIGAYSVRLNDRDITFLDTPGHEAFTTMRARGAQVTDVAILVVAADDGIMPQTIEAINHAKAANVEIIVAINKIDKDGADPNRVKQSLMEYELVPEEWGGDTICVEISAKQRINIEGLLEMVLLVADMKELKANPNRLAKGVVIEARVDKGKGPVATVLVQNGTLRQGDVIICGTSVGHVRAMTNDKGRRVKEAGPATPVEIQGLNEAPTGGDDLIVVKDEKLARDVAEQRRQEIQEDKFNAVVKVSLDNLFSQIDEGNMKELPIIVKADVQGSVEAVKQSLEKLSNDEVRVRVIHGGVGAVNESDVMLANASNAIIVGFNVRPDAGALAMSQQNEVDIRLYRVIYQAIEEIEAAMKGMLDPEFKEVVLGYADVRQTFRVPNVGVIAGCYVRQGKISRNASVRVVRDGIIIHEGKIVSLKRFKDDAKEVTEKFECGIGIENFNDIKEEDTIECFEMQEVER
ncbi:MAG: translation initiation factor IF-2 [Clostridia bacterium]|nr:translation initiation factor IF-2 [Clostridia bacterium]